MPYLGNVIQLGNHSGNFKVLDDIKTHTATFDGSASSVVSTSNDTIRIAKHRFIQGQRVTYTNGGGGDIGGLTNNTAYFIIFDSNETFKLATSASNAANSTAINLSAVGSGTSHTLNVAFDGTNTKFKATTGGGSIVKVSDPVQLNIAINNVVQKPNPKSAVLSEGFTIEDSHKIVFATAPSSNEVFWGSLIAKTVQTFDISDNKIDNFTGDGSTTEFTLSRIPPNSNSILVTLDGVTQHPTDASGTRSYSLDGNNLEFTAAPGNGVEIQVRHIGFAGASSASVTGFYGRTGNVTLRSSDNITTGDITSRNINASGIITASSFIGDGSDLTNLPAGLGTALSSTQSSPLNKMYFTDQVLGIGATLTVNAPASSNTAYTQYQDIKVESNADLIVADGDDFIPDVLGLNNFATLGGGAGGRIRIDRITNQSANGAVFIENGVVVSGIATLSTLNNQNLSGITTVQDLDVDGHTNLDNVSVSGITTFSGIVDAVNTPASIRVAQDIQHKGDADTKITFPANDTISFDTAGSERIRIASDGKVGINSTSPTNPLDVVGSIMIRTSAGTNATLNINEGTTTNPLRFQQTATEGLIQNIASLPLNIRSQSGSGSTGYLAFWTRDSERLRIAPAGAFGLSGANYGTAGQVLVSQGPSSAPTWSGGTTRTLEYISAPCSNESIATYWGSRSTQQVSGVQSLTSTYADLTGSSITYRPPVGAHTVIYRFSFQFSQSDADPIVHFRFYVGGQEIIYARHTKRGDDHQDRTTFEWPIRIDGSQADNLNHGRLQSWNGDKVLKMQAREYNDSYEAKMHVTQNWDGTGTDMFSMPVITIIALGS